MIIFSIYRSWEPYDVVPNTAQWIGQTKKMCKFLPAMEFISNILQFTQCLISSILDLLKRKWLRYITSNIQQTALT
jgi:hypothetical protein